LEGLDQWSATSEQRTAYFTHLPAGKYVFRVQAFAIDNPDAISEASIPVEQLPHFYATFAFFVCCAGALISLLVLLYRFRLHQMKLRFQAVNEERARLAREMHDTVIQGCVGVSTLLEATLGIDSSDEPLKLQLLSYASDQISATIEEARESVWALRNTSKFSTDIASLCRALVHKFESKSPIPIAINVTGEPFLLGDSTTHELMMVIREAFVNAVMHSEATRIHLNVMFTNSELEVNVRDNGIGFDPEQAKSQKEHFGITGMKERVELIGGKMMITSSAGNGTLVSITMPRRSRMASSMEVIHGRHSPDND
jgi:signal transduction histidine kinase